MELCIASPSAPPQQSGEQTEHVIHVILYELNEKLQGKVEKEREE